MKLYEITCAGFEGDTDKTDDRVLWVKATPKDMLAINPNQYGATIYLFPEPLETSEPESAIDYTLPQDTEAFIEKMTYFQNTPADEETKPDWTKDCENCGATPIVPCTGLCGPCTFGEADTADGNW